MAKISFTSVYWDGTETPADSLEVRFWGSGGKETQFFRIGSGENFDASGNVWMEVLYTVHGAQIFYTRNFLHSSYDSDVANVEARFNEIVAAGEGHFGFGEMLPESGIGLKIIKIPGEGASAQDETHSYCTIEVDLDTGSVFGSSPPGERKITLALKIVRFEDGVQFMRDLIHELDDAHHGKHPNPALLSPSSDWSFSRQLNEKAYNFLSSGYQEKYFEHPLVTEAFDGWLAQLPPGGHVLDAGCGHGDPVIAHLQDKGFQVTGADFSPAMLKKAQERFPQVAFVNKMTTEIDFEEQFDGVCSFSSILYLDPIDLFYSIYRLYHALKPGGLLLLYGYDLHPGWRGAPLDTVMKQWMWSWTYSPDEIARALEEHGFFEVLDVINVTTEQEQEEQRIRAIKQKIADEKRLDKMFAALKARYIAQGGENVRVVEPLTLTEAGSMLAAAPKMPESGAHVSEAMEEADETDETEFDLSVLSDPKYNIPAKGLPYHYIIVARRK